MGVTRRQLLTGATVAGAAGIGSPWLRGAHALMTPARLYPATDLSVFDTPVHRGALELRVGCAAITWDGKDEQAIEQIAAVGYPGIQLRTNVLKEYPDASALKDLLAKHHLTFVALSSGGTTLETTKANETVEEHAAHAKYLHAAGGNYLQVIGAGNPKGGVAHWTPEDYKKTGAMLTEIGKHAAEYGIQTGFHNHMGTIGQTPEATEAILSAADAKYVKLELDVAHYLQGGGDPAAAVKRYGRRLLFLHLKDVVDAKETKGGYQFVELGQGRVDFHALLAALEAEHFRGWAVVELDGERPGATRTPQQSAQMSKEYLDRMGVRV